MLKKQNQIKQKRRNKIITLTIVFSIILYVAGTITGLYANKIFTEQISKDLNQIKSELDNSALDIKNIQLKQYYIENFEKNSCEFIEIYNKHQLEMIEKFWSTLPLKLEEYEKNNELTQEYVAIKREYIRFSLRYWLTLKNYYVDCNQKTIMPILYFYSKDCESCLKQSSEFDKLKIDLNKENKTLIVFPIDGEFKEDLVIMLKEYYNIKEYPATIINHNIIRGKVITKEELIMAINI